MKSSTNYVSLIETWLKRRTKSNGVRRVGASNIALSTDLGSVRDENQDRAVVARFTKKESSSRIICVTADGMGGMESGLDCAVKAVSSFLMGCLQHIEAPIEKMLHEAVLTADKHVHHAHHGRGGATLSAICFAETGKMYAVNVGDSRVYGIIEGNLKQLSKDDTLEGQFGNDGNLFQGRHELIQFVGMGGDIVPNSIPFPQESKGWLISTDGVHFMASEVLEKVAKNASESGVAAFRLTEMSKWLGGNDNATCIVQLRPEESWDFFRGPVAGLLEIWDSFGDLQLFIDNSVPSTDAVQDVGRSSGNASPIVSDPDKKESLVKKSSESAGNKKSTGGHKKRKPKAEAPGKKDDEASSRKNKPQLKMKFDDSKDG
ncbi:PP2C family protein-serine/threonine phosphatase [Microbulbifer sediminum]|uniref:PP2C family protein-serine/threonine phosphatase n=1 Tax=Microbulbifer sediminum TaxID=2904250 RepID=UPI001F47C778|nr:protein phosphatase 2C domain-containing protein [Microbulbifer sediminum]